MTSLLLVTIDVNSKTWHFSLYAWLCGFTFRLLKVFVGETIKGALATGKQWNHLIRYIGDFALRFSSACSCPRDDFTTFKRISYFKSFFLNELKPFCYVCVSHDDNVACPKWRVPSCPRRHPPRADGFCCENGGLPAHVEASGAGLPVEPWPN